MESEEIIQNLKPEKKTKKRGGKKHSGAVILDCPAGDGEESLVKEQDLTVPPKKVRYTPPVDTSTPPVDLPTESGAPRSTETPPPLQPPPQAPLSKTKTKKKRGKKDKSKPPELEPGLDPNLENIEIESTHSGSTPVSVAETAEHARTPTPPPPLLTAEEVPSEQAPKPTVSKKSKKKTRVIIREPIDISAVEDKSETENPEPVKPSEEEKKEEEEEEEKVDPAKIDFQIASTSKEYALHTSSGRRTRRIRYV